jgi:thiaminase/transcriptional activator TenA
MERARLSGCRARMLAVLTVAEWTYLDWASPHAPPSPDLPFWASEWIELHAGEGFEAVVAYLREQLDAEWARLAVDDRAATEAAFAEAAALERRFFDAAWAGFGAS